MIVVDESASRRICAHMNDDHAATVHAMVRSSLSGREARLKITNARMKSVSSSGYTLSSVLCDGDLCSMRAVDVPFRPPLSSADEARPRLVKDHHKALHPRFSWILTDPLIAFILVVCAAMGFATHVVGSEGLVSWIEGWPRLNTTVSSLFGSPATFSAIVAAAWYFSIFAHTAEAVYVACECRRTLKTTPATALNWFVLTCCAGFPVTRKATELFEVAKIAGAKKS